MLITFTRSFEIPLLKYKLHGELQVNISSFPHDHALEVPLLTLIREMAP